MANKIIFSGKFSASSIQDLVSQDEIEDEAKKTLKIGPVQY